MENNTQDNNHPEGCILTPRQLAVCRALRDGKTGKEIAAELGVAYKTVDNLRAFAYARMGVNKLALMIKWLNDNKL